MRLAPSSLAGQLALLLLLALVVAQGIAIALFAAERSEAVQHAHRESIIARAGTVAQLLRETPPALHGATSPRRATARHSSHWTRNPRSTPRERENGPPPSSATWRARSMSSGSE